MVNDNGERERLVAELKEYARFMGSYEDEPERKRLMTEAADLLEADAAELADARRYRWLRGTSRCDQQDAGVDLSWYGPNDKTLDAAIDAALASPLKEAVTGSGGSAPATFTVPFVQAAPQHECTIVRSEDPSAPAYLALGAVNPTRERCE